MFGNNIEKKKFFSFHSLYLEMKISSVGDLIRKLKAEKASKEAIDAEVKVLLRLKELFKKKTGQDWKPSSQAKPDSKKKKEPSPVKSAGDDQSQVELNISEK